MRTEGLGFLVFLVPPFVTIVVRIIIDSSKSGASLLSMVLSISGIILFAIAAIQDKKVGIDLRHRDAWTRNILESPHTFFGIPMRLIAMAYILTSLFV